MTPLDTNSILTLRKLSDAATTGTEENDRYVMDGLSVAPPAYMDDEDRAWRDFVAALLPTTVSALCRLALEGVAMKRALFCEVECTEAERVHGIAMKIADTLESGEAK